jgi:hypothetical protein
MKILLAALFSLAAAAAQAHESLVPHSHPHGMSMLPDISTVLCALFALAAALLVYRKFGRSP